MCYWQALGVRGWELKCGMAVLVGEFGSTEDKDIDGDPLNDG